LNAAASGRAGTACAGLAFSTSIIDQGQTKYRFTPSSPVVLGTPGSPTAGCIIDFSMDVLRLPSLDVAANPGMQTIQVPFASGVLGISGLLASSIPGLYLATIAPSPINPCLDLDGDGAVRALTDGLMLMRALFGLTGNAVTNGAIAAPAPPRATWAAIRTYMNTNCGTSFGP